MRTCDFGGAKEYINCEVPSFPCFLVHHTSNIFYQNPWYPSSWVLCPPSLQNKHQSTTCLRNPSKNHLHDCHDSSCLLENIRQSKRTTFSSCRRLQNHITMDTWTENPPSSLKVETILDNIHDSCLDTPVGYYQNQFGHRSCPLFLPASCFSKLRRKGPMLRPSPPSQYPPTSTSPSTGLVSRNFFSKKHMSGAFRLSKNTQR